MVEASICPIWYFSIISLAESLWPISSKSAVASFPGSNQEQGLAFNIKTAGLYAETMKYKGSMAHQLQLAKPHLPQDAHP